MKTKKFECLHTEMPFTYLAHHDAAQHLTKLSYKQERCRECGLFARWINITSGELLGSIYDTEWSRPFHDAVVCRERIEGDVCL